MPVGAMSFFECPYCGKKAVTGAEIGDQFWLFSKNKMCQSCYKPIRTNAEALLVYFIIAPAISIACSLVLFYFLDAVFEINKSLNLVLFFALLIFFFVALFKFQSRKLGLKMFMEK